MSDDRLAPSERSRPALLVVSTSGRMLARAARRAGWNALVVDAFGDVDTRAVAQGWLGAELDAAGGLEPDSVLRAVRRLAPGGGLPLIVGSGLECAPWLLHELAREFRLAGNAPAVWELLARPDRWFALLRELHIPHPDVAPVSAARDGRWLAKRAGSNGGRHVRELAASQALDGPGWYAQRHIDGTVCSMLFAADGEHLRVVGFNRMLAPAPAAPGPFAFGGASAPAALPKTVRADIVRATQRLVRRLGLRGLCGVDFVLDGLRWYLLELNARPTATVELWDVQGRPPLLDWHLRACGGTLPPPVQAIGGAHALAVAYASRELRVPDDVSWPGWCRDLPAPGQHIAAGAPLCTVHARHVAPARAAALAAARAASVERRLHVMNPSPRAAGHVGIQAGVCA